MAGASKSKRADGLAAPFKVTDGSRFRLANVDPGDTREIKAKKKAQLILQEGIGRLAALQEKLYAQDQWGVLLIFQAMDAAGKDSTIEHVMSGDQPAGVPGLLVQGRRPPRSSTTTSSGGPRSAYRSAAGSASSTAPTTRRCSSSGFTRSSSAGRSCPRGLAGEAASGSERFEDIAAFERYLARNGYVILKFFLHVSKDEQKKRFLERLEEPEKNWKFSMADVEERARWDDYMAAYEDMIRHTAADARAVVRRPRRQQVVHPPRRRRGHPGGARRTGPFVPAGRRCEEEGARGGTEGAAGRVGRVEWCSEEQSWRPITSRAHLLDPSA